MTLVPYDTDRLNGLSLRIFDIAASIRRMSLIQKDLEIREFNLHEKKALEWIENLEHWAQLAESKAEAMAAHRRGQLRRNNP